MSSHTQPIRFARSHDGVRLAYATSGEGPMLVKAATWLSHLEHDWGSPVWRHWLQALSARYQLLRYDERCCGLSDWEVPELSFESEHDCPYLIGPVREGPSSLEQRARFLVDS